jgi:hypothetical protein
MAVSIEAAVDFARATHAMAFGRTDANRYGWQQEEQQGESQFTGWTGW